MCSSSDCVQQQTHLMPMSLREQWEGERDRAGGGGVRGKDMPKIWKQVSQYTLKFLTFFSIQPSMEEA